MTVLPTGYALTDKPIQRSVRTSAWMLGCGRDPAAFLELPVDLDCHPPTSRLLLQDSTHGCFPARTIPVRSLYLGRKRGLLSLSVLRVAYHGLKGSNSTFRALSFIVRFRFDPSVSCRVSPELLKQLANGEITGIVHAAPTLTVAELRRKGWSLISPPVDNSGGVAAAFRQSLLGWTPLVETVPTAERCGTERQLVTDCYKEWSSRSVGDDEEPGDAKAEDCQREE